MQYSRNYCLTTILLLLGSGSASPAIGDDYSSARAELIAAYEEEDFAAMQTAAELALRARPRYPAALFNLALAKTPGGDSAMASLRSRNRANAMASNRAVARYCTRKWKTIRAADATHPAA